MKQPSSIFNGHEINKHMKSLIYPNTFMLTGYFTIASICSFGQKTEINLNAYSGIFSYIGNGSTSSSKIISGIFVKPFTANTYGKNGAFSFSLETQVIKNTKTHFLYGIGLAYESLISRVRIDSVVFNGEVIRLIEPTFDANGKTKLTNTYLNLNPFVGKRFIRGMLSFDVLTGIDLGLCLTSHEDGSATDTSKRVVVTNNDEPRPAIDFRPRIQLKAQYKKVGILFGYSFGLTNYQTTGNSKVYTNFLRMGLSYAIR